ncbi:MAG: hypothetical protein QME58_02880 [Bacteroidota bacterium]|nr:hypothetical protein [Bacteroidota bacterium]
MIKFLSTVFTLVLLLSFAAFTQEPTTNIGGYGELHINVPEGSLKKEADFHRFIIYVGHNFNEKWSFMSELEIEHAGKEVELEQAYLEYRHSKALGFRAGVLLQPLGIINQYHEPPMFFGTERPNFEKSIIPTTWWENGIGIFGRITDEIDYTAQITSGLRADGFTAKDGLRGGRQKAIESFSENPSFIGSINYTPMPELKIGGGVFFGNSVPANDKRSGKIDANGFVSLGVTHLQYKRNNFEFKAEYALVNLADADKINRAYPTITEKTVNQKIVNISGDTLTIPTIQKTSAQNNVASLMNGILIEGAYNFLPCLIETSEELWAFARLEKYNTQAEMPSGFVADSRYNRTEITFGFSYKPVYNAVVKADLQMFGNEKDGFGNNIKQFNFGIGYYFF